MKKNKEIKRANDEYEYLTGDEEIQRIEELREKWIRDYNSGMHDSYETGVEEGKTESKIEIAKTMLKEKFDVKVISKITKLSIEDIEKLK